MGQSHPSTPHQRVQWVSYMLAHPGHYGLISQISRTLGVSRPTLYAWKAKADLALEQAFLDTSSISLPQATLERQILTLLVEGHTSYAGIQSCLHCLTQQHVSIGTIAAIVKEAQRRALDWMSTHTPKSSRSLALDEIYANDRKGAYLNVVDCDSWAVWASEGPLAVDAESWTLLLWLAQERGLSWHTTVSDGGDAIGSACRLVDPNGCHQRDLWHLFHSWNQTLRRVGRRLTHLQAQTATVERQAARIAAGLKARGGRPRSDLTAHQAELSQVQRTEADLGFLGQELRRILAVVLLSGAGVQDLAWRKQELAALLELLKEVQQQSLASLQGEVGRLHSTVRLAQEAALAFVVRLDAVQQECRVVLGSDGLALLGWAWQRRSVLEMDADGLVAALPPAWQAAARVVLRAWETATRASSAVENWHSIMRPHLAVHRSLSSGMLALLAVWHNHRIFKRGVHKGHSPLQLSGMLEAPTDWLLALGYPPASSLTVPQPMIESLALAA